MTKILVVDDSSLACQMLRQILESVGHQVIEANNGDSALDSYHRDQPRLGLLDLVMAGMSGFEVLQKLQELDRTAQIIIASADRQTLTDSLVKEAGAIGFIHKPFAPTQVLEAIDTALLEQRYEHDHRATGCHHRIV